jgi:Pup amidohydrolase
MAMRRVMGTETEYGIQDGDAGSVVGAYKRSVKRHANLSETNRSVVSGLTDVGGHIGGDYGSIAHQVGQLSLPFYVDASCYVPPLQTYPAAQYRFGQESYGCESGSMLRNGARFYVDMGHPEYSTPEASNPRDALIADKAGERIVHEAARSANKHIKIYKNNSDGNGNSYGCHENYTMRRVTSSEFQEIVAPALAPFFATRQVYVGSGKIGLEDPSRTASWSFRGFFKGESKEPGYQRICETVLEDLDRMGRHFLDIPEFKDVERQLRELVALRSSRGEQQVYQLSQRADFFECLLGLQTTHNRPLINTRDEPHADSSKYMRLHVICGDANLSQVATYMKLGTTSLVLDLIEDGHAPRITLSNPVKAARDISSDLSRKWMVETEGGNRTSAVGIQRLYLDAAKIYAGRDTMTDDVLRRWETTLDALETDPMGLAGSVDWVAKLYLLNHLMEQSGIGMSHPKIRNAALQYHDIDPAASLFTFMERRGVLERLVSDEEIAQGVSNPPEDTRAYLRGHAQALDAVSQVDWGGFIVKAKKDEYEVKLQSPFAGTRAQIGSAIDDSTKPSELLQILSGIEGVEITKKASFSIGGYDWRKSSKKSRGEHHESGPIISGETYGSE